VKTPKNHIDNEVYHRSPKKTLNKPAKIPCKSTKNSSKSSRRHQKYGQKAFYDIDIPRTSIERHRQCDICQSPEPSEGSIDLSTDCGNMITPIKIITKSNAQILCLKNIRDKIVTKKKRRKRTQLVIFVYWQHHRFRRI
jgi:hypothetical protein